VQAAVDRMVVVMPNPRVQQRGRSPREITPRGGAIVDRSFQCSARSFQCAAVAGFWRAERLMATRSRQRACAAVVVEDLPEP
jgi:hypothetical protein